MASFTQPHEIGIVRSLLEAEGIKCYVHDELTAQINFYSQAIGGVKLKVRDTDVIQAIKIMKAAGFIQTEPRIDGRMGAMLQRLDKQSSNIPYVGKWRLEARLLIGMILLVSALVSLTYWLLSV